MHQRGPERLAALLGSLSVGTDLVDGYPEDHSIRTATIAEAVARAMGLPVAVTADAYWGALVKLLGCTGFSIEETRFGALDDIGLRRALGHVDDRSPTEFVRAAVREVAVGAPPLTRVRALGSLLTKPAAAARHHSAQCEAGVELGTRLRLGEGVLLGLRHDKARWDGRGHPTGIAGVDVSIVARIAVVAEQYDLFRRRDGVAAAVAMVQRRSGGWFDPDVCEALVGTRDARAAADGDGADAWDAFLEAEPVPVALIAEHSVDVAAETFARFVDMKSAWTLTHSSGVGALAERVAVAAGYAQDRIDRLRRAGLLHDIGRAAVSNRIWDAPTSLSSSQWERVRLHSYWTDRILSRSPLLADLAPVASGVHERVDGRGYHRSLPTEVLDPDAGLLAAVDAFHAMGEDRPYRPRWTDAERVRLFTRAGDEGRLSRSAVELVLDAVGSGSTTDHGGAHRGGVTSRPGGLSEREIEVAVHVARGATNKDVARSLGITPKTVAHHVAHIYTKLGVSSRAGLALFAIDHGLLRR